MKRLIVLCLFALAARADTVEHTRKNIQVLQGLQEDDLFPAMNVVAQSLGVHCDYCHVKHDKTWVWESDEKRPKLIARDMIRMMRTIDSASFSGRDAVTCYSCHHGSTTVAAVPPLPPIDPTLAPPPPTLPDVDTIFRHYFTAVGANTAQPVTFDLNVERPAGNARTRVTVAPPDQYELVITREGKTTTQNVNAASSAQLLRIVHIYDVVKAQPAAEMNVTGIEKIGGRDAYVVAHPGGADYFDVESGLLVRTTHVTNTSLVPMPDQVDYEDYRDVDGIRVPFRIRTTTAAPFDTATRIVTAVKRGAP